MLRVGAEERTFRVFRHEGPSRSVRKNTVLAAYLACVAGFVNSSGFVMLGTFTSHVTGSVGRSSTDLAAGDLSGSARAAGLVISFFLGAFLASVVLATDFHKKPSAYGAALLVEAGSLASCALISADSVGITRGLQAAVMCFAMGLQNSLVTRLSGTVVRTTHLTGVVTDLGIEAAHWLQWASRRRLGGTQGCASHDSSRPTLAKTLLLLTVICSFVCGGVLGASVAVHARTAAMIAPALAVFVASAYAFSSSTDRR